GELGGVGGEPIIVALRPAVFNGEIGTLGIPRLGETLAHRGDAPRVRACRLAAQIPDQRHHRLLPTRRERPRRRAAQQRNEGPAFYSAHSRVSGNPGATLCGSGSPLSRGRTEFGIAPLHVWMAPAWQEKIERAAQKSLAVMCPACSRSPDGLLALMGSANRGLITRAGSMSR